jgi:uncharacterized protein YndB with AHSA1/START domain
VTWFIPGRRYEPRSRALSGVQRSRALPAPPAEVWKVVEDAHEMPRWWPGVRRMEGVEEERFTQVFQTKRRRPVRADFHVLASEPPGVHYPAPGQRSWAQDVAGTPFDTVLQESIIEVVVEPAPEGSRVTIAQRQRLRGYSRTGTLVVRRATVKRLDEALDGLERIFGPSD